MSPFSICICQLNHIDQIIQNEIVNCFPRYWNEDHITYSWLKKLISEWPSISLNPQPTTSVQWDAYKMDGKLEQENGDVAFLIDIKFDNGNTLIGVGFLEAKRIYTSGSFDALKYPQLKLLSANSSSHQLLLYDNDPMPTRYSLGGCYPFCCCSGCEPYLSCYCELSEVSAAIVVPTLHAIAYEEKGKKLEKIGHRLSEQIVLRYFRGLDLDFDPDLVTRVLAGVVGGAQYLAVATVQIGAGANALDADDSQDRKPIKPDEGSGYQRLNLEDHRQG